LAVSQPDETTNTKRFAEPGTTGSMSQHILYAYAVGLEFSEITSALTAQIEAFIANRRWTCPEIWSVDQSRNSEDWALGLNLALPNPSAEIPGWYADVEAIVAFCTESRHEFNCDFVIGIADSRTGCGEDIVDIDSDRPNYGYLRKFIGTEPPPPGAF
jgi:hypothetical protein